MSRAEYEREYKRERERDRLKRVIGWALVSVEIDADPPTPLWSEGIYRSEEDAKKAAGVLEAEDVRWDETGWRHYVVRVYPTQRLDLKG